MEYINWWHQLPWAVISLGALGVLAVTVARPGERGRFLAVATGVWAVWYLVLTALGVWAL